MDVDKAPDAFRTISEVADELEVPQHVLRFWESRFHEIRPMKRGGGRRYYRPDDVDLLRGIRHLLYGEGYTIRGVQRILKEQGRNLCRTSGSRARRSRRPPLKRRREGSRSTVRNGKKARMAPTKAHVGFGYSKCWSRFPHQHVHKLQALLDELAECRRLLDRALKERS